MHIPVLFLAGLLAFLPSVLTADPSHAGDCPGSRELSYFSFSLARVYLHLGLFDKSEELIREAAILDDCSADLYAEAASMFLKMRKDRAAEEFAGLALRLDPELIDAIKIQVILKANLAFSIKSDELFEQGIALSRKAIDKDPQDSRMRFILVKFLLERGDFPGCGEALRDYILAFRQNAEPVFLAAESMGRAERMGNGETLAATLMQGDALEGSLLMKIAEPLEEERNFKAAHILYQSYLKHRADREILFRDAMALYEMGMNEEVARALDQKEFRGEEGPDFLHLQARVSARIGKRMKAVEVYKRLLSSEPENAEIAAELAELFDDMGDLKNAVHHFQIALRFFPDSEPTRKVKLAFLLKVASLYQELGEGDRSLETLAKSKEYGGEKELFYHILLSLVSERSSQRQALNVLDEAERLLGFQPDLEARRAEIHAAKSAAKAEKTLKSLLVRTNGSRESYLLASGVFVKRGDFERGYRFLQEALEKHPDPELCLSMGSLLERWGKYDEAEIFLKKAIALEPSHAVALNYLGYMLAERSDRLEEALDYVMQALAIDRYNGAYLDSLGYIYLRMKVYHLARENLLAAAEIFPFDPDIRDHLGDLYFASGEMENALQEWKKSLEFKIRTKENVLEKVKKAEQTIAARDPSILSPIK